MLTNNLQNADNQFFNLRYTRTVGATSLLGIVGKPPIASGYLSMANCKQCGNEFVPFGYRVLFCTPACGIVYRKNNPIKLTQELVKSLLDYREDGVLIWKRGIIVKNLSEDRIAGAIWQRDGITKNRLSILNKSYQTSRVIFLWHHGYEPEVVDHIDGDRLNDRIENLRAATFSQNSSNKKKPKNSRYSIYKGVNVHKLKSGIVYKAVVTCKKILYRLGTFNTEEEAALAYNRGAIMYQREFAKLNIIKPKS